MNFSFAKRNEKKARPTASAELREVLFSWQPTMAARRREFVRTAYTERQKVVTRGTTIFS
jgi:hypothetical protein